MLKLLAIVTGVLAVLIIGSITIADFTLEDFLIYIEKRHKELYAEEIELNGYTDFWVYMKKAAKESATSIPKWFWKILRDFWKHQRKEKENRKHQKQ